MDCDADFALALPAGQRLQKTDAHPSPYRQSRAFARNLVPGVPVPLRARVAVRSRRNRIVLRYQPVTVPLFLAALFYSYPVTFLCTRLISDDMFFSPGFYLVLALYTALWMFLLRTIFRIFERHVKLQGAAI